MICLAESHFAAIIVIIVVGVAVLTGTTTWYFLKIRCSREKLGQIADSDADVPITVNQKTKNGKYRTEFLSRRARR